MQTIETLRDVARAHTGPIANVGAGAVNWWPADIAADHYDLVPRHSLVAEFDCTAQVLPRPYEIIVCRFVLNHLSARQAFDALANFRKAGKYLLLPTWKNPERYWAAHGFVLPNPVYSAPDYRSHLNLYRLEQLCLPSTNASAIR